jgi:hypothetical protein
MEARPLHHYTSGTALLGIIESGTLWATKIQYMNDYKEFAHALDLAAIELRKRRGQNLRGQVPIFCEALLDVLERISDLTLYVACLSEVEDSLSQWRGYCPPSFGYSLAFDAGLLGAIAKAQGFSLQPCIYDTNLKRPLISNWMERTLTRLHEACPPAADPKEFCERNSGPAITQFIEFAPYLKDSAFKDEREWRLVGLVGSDDPRLRLRGGKSMLVPYVPIKLHLSSDSELLRQVWVGPTPHIRLAVDSLTMLYSKCKLCEGIRTTRIPYRDW